MALTFASMVGASGCSGISTESEPAENTAQIQAPLRQAQADCTPGLAAGPNVNITRLAGNQQEVAIAIDPTDPSRVFAFSNLERAGMFAAFSTDGGVTWLSSAGSGDTAPNDFVIGDGNDTLAPACCDPTVAFDQFGNLFVGYLGSVGSGVPSVIALSTDGGATIAPLATFSASTDQPTVTTGPGSNGSLGSVWITYSGGGIQVQGAAVNGLGAANIGAFTAAVTAPSASQFGDITVGPNGQVMVTGQNDTTIFTDVDPDGFGPLPFAAIDSISVNVDRFDALPPQPDRTVDAEVGLAYDRSGGAQNGRVYMVYTDETPNESNDSDILLRFSDDDGANWSVPVRVNDDATTRSQFLPRIAVDQISGFVGVSFHDARNDDGMGAPGDTDGTPNSNAQLFATMSQDGGLTFLPNIQVSAGTSDEDGSEPPGGGFADLDYGDYAGLAFHDGVLLPAWADNSNSTGDNPDGTLANMDVYTAAVTFNPGDEEAPVFTFVPPDITTTSCGSIDIGMAEATDECDASVDITNDAPAVFPPGTTLVTWTAIDDAGNVATAVQRVTVELTDNPACCPAGTNIITGTSNDDILIGTAGSDCILGLGGQDSIAGLGGDDFVAGGDGDDEVAGGGGDDVIFGGTGQDFITGGSGDDSLSGGDGVDTVQAGDGNDTLNGGQGPDLLQGGPGDDQLNGGTGDDNLQGGDGNDDLVGGENNDQCDGGTGSNTFAQCEFGSPNSCTDTVQNGTETDVDCGGACPGCAEGEMCITGDDCQSGLCTSGLCQAGATNSVTANLSITTDWGGGYCAVLNVTNNAATTASSFTVDLDTNASGIYTSWNGNFTGASGAVTVTPCCSWNAELSPGETDSSIGFCADRTIPGSGTLPFVVSASGTF